MRSHRQRTLRGAIAFALTLGLGFGISPLVASAATSDATINVGSLYEPQNLDNTAGGGQGVTEALYGNVYESLFRLNDDGTTSNLLVKSYSQSSDGLTYTFKLKSGIKFQSGKALTAGDVKFSIEKVLSPTSKSARKSSLGAIASVTAQDADTVVVKLKSRSISLIYNLSYPWIFDSEATDFATKVDGSGPYKFTSWNRGSTLTLTRNDAYWGTAAKNKSVVFHYFIDATALNNALLTGAVDVITSVQSPDALKQFSTSAYKVNNGTSTTKLLLAFNDRVAPFNNKLVRKAVTSAIDRNKLLKSIWGDYGTVTGSMVPPKDPWFEDLTSVNPYDLALAKKELAQAGYANGFTFRLDTPTYDPHPAAAAFIKSELAKVGITVQINSVTDDQWYNNVYKAHDFVATLQEHVNDRDLVWYGNPDFYWGYKNSKVISLINKSETVASPRTQTLYLKQANQIIVDEAASDWIYLYPQIVVASSKLSGYQLNGLNSQFYAYNIVKA
ncbi:MAG: ABC transporter substrate-binding protein [Actinomycetota bacterium]